MGGTIRELQVFARAGLTCYEYADSKENIMLSVIWTVIVGAVVGAVAKFIMPGDNEPKGFVMTAILGIVGALLAGYVGQAIGWYSAGQGAGFIASLVGAIIVLIIYAQVTKPKV
jgi:uncharacterized membrane protein YeaQ/YmgE (transglycosylase-associated protein family)